MSDTQIIEMQTPAIVKHELTVSDIRHQVNTVQHILREIMQQGTHYGTIPGCGPKPALLKPGAEKLCQAFRLAPSVDVRITEMGDDHREYQVVCTLTHAPSGTTIAQGIGSCCTKEKKYRYRWVGQGRDRQREENPDLADTYNTVLKMAKKRAMVDAVLTATAASDIFTQDIEENPPPQEERPKPRPRKQATKPAAKPAKDTKPIEAIETLAARLQDSKSLDELDGIVDYIAEHKAELSDGDRKTLKAEVHAAAGRLRDD